ncbi:energy transducer TonB [Flagellimonas onchidii]|uniref:energy transducer TonB n=1 Tax=Flagellimonas onchidii TaxID=2562684 RepID=UPI0010A69ED1|nr:energy transducer TonB [Allomuricauda onchidii]
MELKKNPKSELKKNSPLYFLIGLTTILLLSYLALEWKIQYKTPDWNIAYVEIQDELIEEVPPITFQLPPPPPSVIPIIEEEIPIMGCNLPIPIDTTGIITCSALNIDNIVFEKEEEEGLIVCPWVFVEEVPIFPSCEDAEDKRACFQEMMQKHIRKNFRYPVMAQEMGLQGRVSVMFTIQKDGSIDEVRMRGPHETLEKEAARIIDKLPKMTPGKQRGKAVKVPFSIPITFKLQ